MPTTPTVQPAPSPVAVPDGPLARFFAHPGDVEADIAHHLARVAASVGDRWPLAAAAAGLLCAWWLLAVVARVLRGRHGRWVAIAPPAEPDPGGGSALWRMLAPLLAARRGLFGVRPPVAFELSAGPEGLRLGLWVSATVPVEGIAASIEAAWPGAQASVCAPPSLPHKGRVSVGRVRLVGGDWLPFATDQLGGDPLRGLFSALCWTDGGSVQLQVLARPAPGRHLARVRRAAWARRRGQPTTRSGRALGLLHRRAAHSASGGAADPLALADVRDATAKVTAGPHFVVGVRYALFGPPGKPGPARRWRRARARQLAAGFGLFSGRARLVCRRDLLPRRGSARVLRTGFLCSLPELAALAHLPTDPAQYGLAAAPARHVAPPVDVAHG